MRYYLLLFLLLSNFQDTYACTCSCTDLKEIQRYDFETSQLIFIGQVTEINDDYTYQFKIVEILKGQHTDSLINGNPLGYCENVPRKQDLNWIVYTSLDDDGTISMDECGLSRSFRMPYLLCEEASVPPPPDTRIGETWGSIESELTQIEYKKRALEVLQAEIEQLRKWRDK